MIVVNLIEKYQATASDSDETSYRGGAHLELAAGFTFHTIDYRYLPNHYKMKWDREETIEHYYIMYTRGYFWKIPKDICNVPISNGWGYNI